MNDRRLSREEYLRTAEIVERLPCIFESDDVRAFPASMTGATIVSIGTVSDRHALEGGGLVINYRHPVSGRAMRAVFAFNELAMWVEVDMCLDNTDGHP